MGLKAGLQIIGKAIANYADDAARLAAQSGDNVARSVVTKADDAVGIFCRKAKPVNPAELKGLRFAPEAIIGDTVNFTKISTADDIIAQLKSTRRTYLGQEMSYDEFGKLYPRNEDVRLYAWARATRPIPSKQVLLCEEEIAKCFDPDNIKKIEVLKNMSNEEIDILLESVDRSQLIAFLSGAKPAYFKSHNGRIDFARAIKSSKYADDYIAIKLNASADSDCLINVRQVKEIIKKNKSIYCEELKLPKNSSIEEIYTKLIDTFENGEYPIMSMGLTLGYPKYSSALFALERCEGVMDGMYQIDKKITQERLLKALNGKDSPFQGYSKDFIKEIEQYILTEDLRYAANGPFEERFFSTFSLYGRELEDLPKIKETEVNFVTNFRMENLMS